MGHLDDFMYSCSKKCPLSRLHYVCVKARVNIFVKGVSKLHCFWDLQGITDRNRPLNKWRFEFGILVDSFFVLLIHVDADLETSQEWEFWKSEGHL
jgi:hypothetical protein